MPSNAFRMTGTNGLGRFQQATLLVFTILLCMPLLVGSVPARSRMANRPSQVVIRTPYPLPRSPSPPPRVPSPAPIRNANGLPYIKGRATNPDDIAMISDYVNHYQFPGGAEEVQCGCCDEKFRPDNVLAHMRRQHLPEPPHQCPENKLKDLRSRGVTFDMVPRADGAPETEDGLCLVIVFIGTYKFPRSPVECPCCGQPFNRGDNMKRHMKDKHLPKKPSETLSQLSAPDVPRLGLDEAATNDADRERILTFFLTTRKLDTLEKCPCCSAPRPRAYSMKIHMVDHLKVPVPDNWTCSYCKDRFDTVDLRETHEGLRKRGARALPECIPRSSTGQLRKQV